MPRAPASDPVWLAAATCERLAAVDPLAVRLDTFLRGLGAAYVDVPVADVGVLGNFNQNGVSR